MLQELKTILEVVEIAVNADSSENYDCNISLEVDGQTYKAYSVSIAYRDVLFYCGNANICYDVNSNGLNDYLVFRDMEL